MNLPPQSILPANHIRVSMTQVRSSQGKCRLSPAALLCTLGAERMHTDLTSQGNAQDVVPDWSCTCNQASASSRLVEGPRSRRMRRRQQMTEKLRQVALEFVLSPLAKYWQQDKRRPRCSNSSSESCTELPQRATRPCKEEWPWINTSSRQGPECKLSNQRARLRKEFHSHRKESIVISMLGWAEHQPLARVPKNSDAFLALIRRIDNLPPQTKVATPSSMAFV